MGFYNRSFWTKKPLLNTIQVYILQIYSTPNLLVRCANMACMVFGGHRPWPLARFILDSAVTLSALLLVAVGLVEGSRAGGLGWVGDI